VTSINRLLPYSASKATTIASLLAEALLGNDDPRQKLRNWLQLRSPPAKVSYSVSKTESTPIFERKSMTHTGLHGDIIPAFLLAPNQVIDSAPAIVIHHPESC